MEVSRIAVLVVMLLAATALITGCGGGGSHEIDSSWYGDLLGVATSPANNDMNVPSSAHIEVYWPSGTPPTYTFTVWLDKEETPGHWVSVPTTRDDDASDPEHAIWWYVPTSELTPFAWYRLTIVGDGLDNPAVVTFRAVSG